MNDVSKTNDLIGSLNRVAGMLDEYAFENNASEAPGLMRQAADALEAATRVPVQGEPNDDREAMVRVDQMLEDLAVGFPLEEIPAHYPDLDWILGSILVIREELSALSRATVPDAATAALERWKGDYFIQKRAADKAEAERDAALAAIERIRQAVSGYPECDRYEEGDVISCGWKSAYASVLAALDGAPEPDDEPCTAEIHSWEKRAFYRNRDIDSYWIRCTLLGKHDDHEDSNTGLKWRSGLPVEGEKP